MKIKIQTEDPTNFERILKTTGKLEKISLFGHKWFIENAYFSAPFNVELTLNNSDINIEIGE